MRALSTKPKLIVVVAFASFALLAPASRTNAQGLVEEERAVRKVIAGYDDAWNRHDAKALVQLFAEDADLVDPRSVYHKGRNEIEKLYAELHSYSLVQAARWEDCRSLCDA